MLRAIAGYILGGIINDSPQETFECETREVNDWLVVNMPDKPEEGDLDFDDSETESINDEEDDDILACVSMLMPPEEYEYNEDLMSDEYPMSDEDLMSDEQEQSMFEEILPSSVDMGANNKLTANTEHVEEIIRGSCHACENIMYHPLYTRFFAYQDIGLLLRKNYYCSPYAAKRHLERIQSVIEIFPPITQQKKEIRQRIKVKYPKKKGLMREVLPKDKSNPDLTCHTIRTPTYLNHRPLVAAAKTDLLQQIKEIQPSQKAKDIALKKHITRSQLNKQNKNYIYCNSAKTNRRKDIQRNHSGANNNRKCC